MDILELISYTLTVTVGIALYDWLVDPILTGIITQIKKRKKKIQPQLQIQDRQKQKKPEATKQVKQDGENIGQEKVGEKEAKAKAL